MYYRTKLKNDMKLNFLYILPFLTLAVCPCRGQECKGVSIANSSIKVENGKMVSGYYMMAPLSNGNNRFILFSNPNKSKGTVIYIEGDLSPEDIMQLCYSRR